MSVPNHGSVHRSPTTCLKKTIGVSIPHPTGYLFSLLDTTLSSPALRTLIWQHTRQVEQKPGGRGREWATLGVHPLSWLLSNNWLEKVPFVSVPHTSSDRLLLSNQDKECTPSVAHSLALPLGPALLNLWTDTRRILNLPRTYTRILAKHWLKMQKTSCFTKWGGVSTLEDFIFLHLILYIWGQVSPRKY